MKMLMVAALAGMLATQAVASDSPVGFWRAGSAQVYVEILASGQAVQCSISQDQSVIKGTGQLKNPTTLEWSPVSITNHQGRTVEAPGFGLGVGPVQVQVNRGKLVLNGKYGRVEFEKSPSSMPKPCQ